MPLIRHEVEIDMTIEEVYDQLTKKERYDMYLYLLLHEEFGEED